ncbi:MAG: hypothetical protein OEZ23_01260 [Gammaproteobacteria bacterium]|nr:hypothetical protein [Gammaproteobacteria bacterium]
MRRWHVTVLLFVCAGIVIGTLMARDPGYVLISYDGSAVQTSIWVFLLLLGMIMLLVYYFMQSSVILFRASGNYKRWRDQANKDKAAAKLVKGLMLIEEGEYENAVKVLLKDAGSEGEARALGLIAAAKAANAMGQYQKREDLIRKAEQLLGESSRAIKLVRARMAMDAGDYQSCMHWLKDMPRHREVLLMLQKAMRNTGSWDALSELMRDISKVIKDDAWLLDLQKRIFLGKLSGVGVKTDDLRKEYKKLLKKTGPDAEITISWSRWLAKHDEELQSEAVLREAIDAEWHEELLIAYGQLGRATAEKRLKQVENWRKLRPQDPCLLRSLGQIQLMLGDLQAAKDSFDKSVARI